MYYAGQNWKHPNPTIDYFWFLRFVWPGGWVKTDYYRHRHFKTWILWQYGAKGLAYLTLFVTFVILVFNIGWVNPFNDTNPFNLNVPGWLFDLLFARANGQPNGAHDISYIAMLLVGVVVWVKFRDPFLALGCIALTISYHEGLGKLRTMPYIRSTFLGSFLPTC